MEVGRGSHPLSHSSPVPNKLYGFWGRKSPWKKKEKKKQLRPELRSCVKVEVVVLGSPTLIVLVVSVDVNAAMNSNSFGLSFGMNLRCLAHMRDAFTDLELDSGIIQIRIIIIQNTKSL